MLAAMCVSVCLSAPANSICCLRNESKHPHDSTRRQQAELNSIAPVPVSYTHLIVTQFDKDKVEAAGLVKFDFLGLKTLDVIESCEKLVNARIARENQRPAQDREQAAGKHPHALRRSDRKAGDPVSYTHLDVYKRQARSAGRSGAASTTARTSAPT